MIVNQQAYSYCRENVIRADVFVFGCISSTKYNIMVDVWEGNSKYNPFISRQGHTQWLAPYIAMRIPLLYCLTFR